MIVSRVLQDEHYLGYVQYSNLVVERVNDHPIRCLRDVADALESPLSGTFHVIEFARNPQRQRMVLDASNMAAATRRVMARYAIAAPRYLASPVDRQ